MNNIGIYYIVNEITRRRYVGSAIDIRRRFNHHLRMLQEDKHDNSYLQRAWNKYGEESFKFEVLLYCDKENLLFYEQRAIDGFRHKNAGVYNLRLNAESNLGMRMSEETKKKISIANKGNDYAKGFKHSAATKAKISEIHKGKCVEFTESHKANLSSALKGRKLSQETRKRMSLSKLGFKHSEETKLKMSERRGWCHTDEAIQKIKEARVRQEQMYGHPRLGTKHSPETIEKLRTIPKTQKQRDAVRESNKRRAQQRRMEA